MTARSDADLIREALNPELDGISKVETFEWRKGLRERHDELARLSDRLLAREQQLRGALEGWLDHYDRGKRPAGSLAAQERWMAEQDKWPEVAREALAAGRQEAK